MWRKGGEEEERGGMMMPSRASIHTCLLYTKRKIPFDNLIRQLNLVQKKFAFSQKRNEEASFFSAKCKAEQSGVFPPCGYFLPAGHEV
jgi:hypothetical protein